MKSSLLIALFGVSAAFSFSPNAVNLLSRSSNIFRQGPSCTIHGATSSNNDRCDVAVFGGGFGGLYTALAIARDAQSRGRKLDVALVEPSDKFVFLPLLYDLTVGTASEGEVCPAYTDLLAGTGVRHVKASFDSFATSDLYSAKITPSQQPEAHSINLSFRASVVAVGATPQSSLASTPGASEYTQPFYTQEDARETRKLLDRLESQVKAGHVPRIAIIGGGFGGVELAACVKRKLNGSFVSLLTRGAPMKGTRGEVLVDKALKRLGVNVDVCSVEAIEPVDTVALEDMTKSRQVRVLTKSLGENGKGDVSRDEPWDAVLWTAGSGPAYPVCNDRMNGLSKVDSGRLAIDSTLRCIWDEDEKSSTVKRLRQPPVWALGDCTEIIDSNGQLAAPKTAQTAMQQSEIAANNVLAELQGTSKVKSFQFQDLGSMLTLGGPNAAVFAPRDDSPFAALFIPLLDTARFGFSFADEALLQLSKSPIAEKVGLTPVMENLGLSLGGYGLGADAETGPGTLSGTLSGAARRALYAARMPTNRQRVYAVASAAFSSAVALARDASEQIDKNNNSNDR
jgi:demethylphylloquinone reductase